MAAAGGTVSGSSSSCKPGRPSTGATPSAADSKLSNQVSTIVSLLSTLCRGSPLVTHVGPHHFSHACIEEENKFVCVHANLQPVFRTCCGRLCLTQWSLHWEEMRGVCSIPCGWWISCWCSCLRDGRRCQSPQQDQRAGYLDCDVWTALESDPTDSSSTVSAARTPTL